MKLIQIYLRNPRIKRALNRKPGDKGFSLIELVVVVAVLAILAAIAVPAYMGMQEQAADAAARTNLKNAYKECAYQMARGIANNGNPVSTTNIATYDFPQDDGFYNYTDTNSGAAIGNCVTVGGTAALPTYTAATLTASKIQGTGTGTTLTIELDDGSRGGTGTW